CPACGAPRKLYFQVTSHTSTSELCSDTAFCPKCGGKANDPQQSWGFGGEPPEAVMKDSGTRDGTLLGQELQFQPVQLLVSDLLTFDVSADRLLIPPDGRNEVAPRPEFVTQKIALLAFHILRNPDRAFPLQIPDHLRHRIFRRDQHMHVVGHQMSFFDLAFLALGKLAGYSAQVPPDLPKQRLLRYFGVNTTWYLPFHVAWFG